MSEERNPVLYEKIRNIGLVTLNRPEVLNAIDFNLGNRLLEVLTTVKSNSSVRSLIITGSGRAFSSGGDIGAMKQSIGAGNPGIFMHKLIQMLNQIVKELRNIKIPVIAAIPGVTSGGGLDVALSCDFRIGSDKLKLKAAYTGIGLVPAGGGSYLLPSIIGPAKALEFFLMNDFMYAKEALKLGLVNKIVSHDQLMKTAFELADILALGATTAYGYTKLLLNEFIAGSGMEHHLAHESTLQGEIMVKTTDFVEGIRAFLEQRPPKFQGK
ncbi:MAG: enoyl-CoA hydratase/isomerase family protein [Candidatus Hodarchaeales archaeon]